MLSNADHTRAGALGFGRTFTTAGAAGRRSLVCLVVALCAGTVFGGVARAAVPGTISTVAGVGLYGALGNAGPATSGEVAWPSDTVDDPGGDMFIADAGTNLVQMVAGSNCVSACPYGLPSTTKGDIYVVAGQTTPGDDGMGGPATSAHISYPTGVRLDPQNDLLISSQGDSRVFLVAREACTANCPYGLDSMVRGDIYSIAGDGAFGYNGDIGLATDIELNEPEGLAVDQAGNLMISDSENRTLRMLADENCQADCPYGLKSLIKGDMYRIWSFGTPAAPGWAIGGGPIALAFDAEGDLLINNQSDILLLAEVSCAFDCQYGLRAMNPGSMYTVAGGSSFGYNGDGLPASSQVQAVGQLNFPIGIAVDGVGDLLIADYENHRVRIVPDIGCTTTCPFGLSNLHKGFMYTAAGNGTAAQTGTKGLTGDGNQATNAELNTPNGLGFDPSGDMLIADYGGQRVREVTTNDPPPVCYEAGARAVGEYGFTGTRDQEDVVVYAPSGLRSISDITVTNGTATHTPFIPGTTGPVVVTVTKTDESSGVSGYYKATDDQNRYSFCGFYIQSSL